MPYPYNMFQPVTGLIQVVGIEGARNYQTAPNTTVPLFDSNEDVFYLKTTDGAGIPSVRVFDFAERIGDTSGEYATKADVSALNGKLDQLLGELK